MLYEHEQQGIFFGKQENMYAFSVMFASFCPSSNPNQPHALFFGCVHSGFHVIMLSRKNMANKLLAAFCGVCLVSNFCLALLCLAWLHKLFSDTPCIKMVYGDK